MVGKKWGPVWERLKEEVVWQKVKAGVVFAVTTWGRRNKEPQVQAGRK